MSIATSGSPSKTSSPKIKKEAIIRVYGFVMMQKVDEGSYRIKYLSGEGTYQFYKRRSKKPIIRHRTETVDAWIKPNGEDLNGIEIIKELP